MEEDVEDVSNGSAEVWDESLEAPFWDYVSDLILSNNGTLCQWANIMLSYAFHGMHAQNSNLCYFALSRCISRSQKVEIFVPSYTM